jgi:hypothetical protein
VADHCEETASACKGDCNLVVIHAEFPVSANEDGSEAGGAGGANP